MPDTTNSPKGVHPLTAQSHHLDLEREADKLLARLPGNSRQTENLAREAGVSMLMMAMEAGDLVAEHSAKGVVTVHLLRGHAMLSAAGEALDLRPGQMVMLQPGVPHDVRAEEQSVLLLIVTGGDR